MCKEAQKAKNKISKEREELLNHIDGWYWDGNENAFTVGFMALEKFYKKYNTSMMDSIYIDEKNFKLGVWCQTRRVTKDQLSDEKISRFNIFHDWSWEGKKEDAWNEFYNELKSFYYLMGT